MVWLSDFLANIIGTATTADVVRKKLFAGEPDAELSNAELTVYIKNIHHRIDRLFKDLISIYSRYDIKFKGFRSLKEACNELEQVIKHGSEISYSNLIKSEATIASELKRHLNLLRMAVDKDGRKIIDKINKHPRQREKFNSIMGYREKDTDRYVDGRYQRLWSEIHKLTEYVIIQKDKVIH